MQSFQEFRVSVTFPRALLVRKHVAMSHDMYKLYNEVEIYTTECRRHEVVYTVETETELYNRLVPWGIATLKLEINIPPQQIFAKSKGGAYN